MRYSNLSRRIPRVIIEALAKGLPTISTLASGNVELLPAKFLVEYNILKNLPIEYKSW